MAWLSAGRKILIGTAGYNFFPQPTEETQEQCLWNGGSTFSLLCAVGMAFFDRISPHLGVFLDKIWRPAFCFPNIQSPSVHIISPHSAGFWRIDKCISQDCYGGVVDFFLIWEIPVLRFVRRENLCVRGQPPLSYVVNPLAWFPSFFLLP